MPITCCACAYDPDPQASVSPAHQAPYRVNPERLLARVNDGGEVFLSHTRLHGRFTLRMAISNLRTEQRHVERAWALIRDAGRHLDGEPWVESGPAIGA